MTTCIQFGCPRTCPEAGALWCRFRPLLDLIGPTRVNSHTARVQIEFRDTAALAAAVRSIGGSWIGLGTHKLFSTNSATGNGFTLPSWRYPLVAEPDGQLAFDLFMNGPAADAELNRLKGAYAVAMVETAAAAQGWQTERTAEGLTVHHPAGGSITVGSGGQLEAHQFTGKSCHDALMQLGLPLTDLTAKPEFTAQAQQIQTPG